MKEKYVNYFIKIAEETAKLSYAKKLQVGAIIVRGERILSLGYNGTPTGWYNACEDIIDNGTNIYMTTKPEVIHAERNALDKLAKSTESSDGAVLFSTHSPCIECAKSIYNTGITKVYYRHKYDGTTGSGENFLLRAGIKTCQVK